MVKVTRGSAYRGHFSDGQDRPHVGLPRNSWQWLRLILEGARGEVFAMAEVTPELCS